ncbi:Uncharacterized protein APZ42_028219 [Daphnia magna]|uniref:Uncharacterized protein n=1 Tax=Daphnia magna TaxID=35525 RepID=A0A164QL20_9CRUS|nr:Uncharacterized protein APZ42_028219 [Daphnia magna]
MSRKKNKWLGDNVRNWRAKRTKLYRRLNLDSFPCCVDGEYRLDCFFALDFSSARRRVVQMQVCSNNNIEKQ